MSANDLPIGGASRNRFWILLRYLAGTTLYACILATAYFSPWIVDSRRLFILVSASAAIGLACCCLGFLLGIISNSASGNDSCVQFLMVCYALLIWMTELPRKLSHPSDCLLLIMLIYPIGVMAMVDFIRRRWLMSLGWHLLVLAAVATMVHNLATSYASIGFRTIIGK